MDRLLGHLAQFSAFSKQGELLCTHALAYLLRNPQGERAFSGFVSSVAGCPLAGGLDWRPESTQPDGGRPDLEGRDREGTAVAKVEAKLGAPFGEGQLDSYLAAFERGETPRVLLILVPTSRRAEVVSHICGYFRLAGAGPWQVASPAIVHIAVAAWEQVFEALASVSTGSFEDDLGQFRAMYRVFNGDDMEPLTRDEQVLAWRERENWWLKLVDLATRQLSPAEQPNLPFGLEKGPHPYNRRYVCRQLAGGHSCFSIGTRDPFQGHRTPIWMRFNKTTGEFARILSEVERAGLRAEAVRSGGHLWFPLEVPRDANRDTMIEALVAQVHRITREVY